MAWLEKNGSDPLVASALLTSPACVSDMSDTELSFLRQRVEQHFSPEIAKARDDTLQALRDAEQGLQTAMDKIAEHAGLRKGADGM